MKAQVLVFAALSVLAPAASAASRFQTDYDLNRDGRVTHDELNRTQGARFASAAHGPSMSAEQFAALDGQRLSVHARQAFRRIDWNGDGKLSLDEYAQPERVRFQAMDRDGRGSESCAPVQNAAYRPNGRARFCAENDLDRDGAVSHAEFDRATAKRFASLTANAGTMSEAQYASEAAIRWRAAGLRYFKQLDANHDGRLSLAEYAAPDQKLFNRMDRDRDGVATGDEMRMRYPRGD
jgi:EF hand